MINYPSDIYERTKLYLRVMEEIKYRIKYLNENLDSLSGAGVKYEVCTLQLRHICELIAMSCIVSQGDFTTYKSLNKEYSPSKIFYTLEKLNRDFFPVDVVIKRESDQIFYARGNNKKSISRIELQSLWSRSGDALHRASLNKFLRNVTIPKTHFDKIVKDRDSIVELMKSHSIKTIDSNLWIHAVLWPGGDDNKTVVQYLNFKESGLHIETFKAG